MSPVYDPDAEVAQGGQSEKMPTGRYDVTIEKVVVSKKDGTLFKTQKGHRQIMVVFQNEAGQEAGSLYPLEGPARWRFSELIHGIGENTASLKQKGFTDPTMLLAQKVADHWLVKRKLTIEAKFDGKYHDVSVVMPAKEAEPVAGAGIGKPPPRDDVPF